MKEALDKDQPPAAVRNWARDPGSWLTAATGIGVFFFLLWLHFKWDGENYKLLINDLSYLAVGLISTALLWRTSTHPQLEPRARRGWKALALAKFIYWIGNLIWAYNVLIRGEKPFPSWADAAYLVLLLISNARNSVGMFFEPSAHLVIGPSPFNRLGVAVVVFGPCRHDMLNEFVPTGP